MSAAGLLAGYALHAAWQVPLLAGAGWCAVRIGRPRPNVAHVLWVATLLLSVSLPVVATVAARDAAQRAQRDAAVALIFETGGSDLQLPALQRQPAWQRLLQRHLSRANGVRPFQLELPVRFERPVASGYVVCCVFAALRLLLAWLRMRGVVRRSRACTLPGVQGAACRVAKGLPLPQVCLCSEVPGPALAGVWRPVLLLPDSMVDLQPGELEAVLAHELAHLRRHDPLCHLLCSLLLVPVSFHPAAWWVARRIRQTREIACDAAAAGALQSRPAYARALLRVADRVGVQTGTDGVFGNGLFGAGLELWNRKGNLEERMQMLMMSQPAGTRGGRAVRVGTCSSIGAAAVLAAAMVQVRPALAGQQAALPAQASAPTVSATAPQESAEDLGPRLLGGEHARQQLRHAGRELAEAERSATSDEERHRIAAAREVAAAAEAAIASANGSGRAAADLDSPRDIHVDLSGLQVDLTDLKARMDLQRKAMETWRLKLDSPEWRAQMESQRKLAEKLHAQLNSPEWKEQMRQRQEVFDKAAAQFRSPEFRARIDAASRIDSAKLASILADAEQQQQRALEQLRSGELQRQIDRATQLVARNEIREPMLAGNAAGEPVKVASEAMSANALQKTMPKYPPEAKEKKIQGEVLLHAIIGESGRVEQLTVVRSPDALLSQSALEAVQQWTYKPYLLNGKPVAVDTTITVHYSFAP